MTCFHSNYMFIPTSHPIHKFADFFEKFYTRATMKYHLHYELNLWNYQQYYPIEMKCHRCIGCRLDHANEIATRIYCESITCNGNGCFITLTYSPENLPLTETGEKTLCVEHTQKFWHDLRQKHPELSIRYVIAGEYGTKSTKRPHYHACVFGYKPKDLKFYKYSKADKKLKLYKSKEVTNLWKKGICVIGEIEYRSACYVARYVQKKAGINPEKKEYQNEKILNKKAPTMQECEQYAKFLLTEKTIAKNKITKYESKEERAKPKKREYNIDEKTIKRLARIIFKKTRLRWKKTEIKDPNKRKEEFILYSLRPAIGLEYWNTHKEEIKRNNGIFVYFDKKVKLKPIPNYFKKKWKEENPDEYYRWQYQQTKNSIEILSNKIQKLNVPNWWSYEQRLKFLREKEEANLLNKCKKAKLNERDNFI